MKNRNIKQYVTVTYNVNVEQLSVFKPRLLVLSDESKQKVVDFVIEHSSRCGIANPKDFDKKSIDLQEYILQDLNGKSAICSTYIPSEDETYPVGLLVLSNGPALFISDVLDNQYNSLLDKYINFLVLMEINPNMGV